MKPVDLVSENIRAGKDVVVAEEHTQISQTFDIMREVITQNPKGISAVSLELPVGIQEHLDDVSNGNISRELFIKQARITMEQGYIPVAADLMSQGKISQEQYDSYEGYINQRVDNIINDEFGIYTQEESAIDQKAFGSLYDLTQVAAANNVPVYASDVGREFSVLDDLDQVYLGDWLNRLDDVSDFDLLSRQVDLDNAGPLLIHRGASHVWGLDSERKGLDDLLEDNGRQIVTIGHWSSQKSLTDEFNVQTGDLGLPVSDPTDFIIINGVGYEQPDISFYQKPVQPNVLSPP